MRHDAVRIVGTEPRAADVVVGISLAARSSWQPRQDGFVLVMQLEHESLAVEVAEVCRRIEQNGFSRLVACESDFKTPNLLTLKVAASGDASATARIGQRLITLLRRYLRELEAKRADEQLVEALHATAVRILVRSAAGGGNAHQRRLRRRRFFREALEHLLPAQAVALRRAYAAVEYLVVRSQRRSRRL